MAIEFALDPARTAVLSMDMQNGIVGMYAGSAPEMLARCADVLKAARSRKAQVIHIRVGFRPGLPEVSERNMLFGAIRSSDRHQQLFHGTGGDIHPALGPEESDIVVTKHRVSAFAGTDLAMILRAQEIDTLVLFGIATSGVVLSTLLEASDADYRLIVVRDCCLDMDADLHACLIDKVFSRRASVVSAAEFVSSIAG
ncbi:MAG TPA: isochorismatase family cysteine hydrolase [Acidobacteriaceae bacterium]|nr:isochorismatase family cysteine hydrolase [Acidobacteriaceae bacterium]